MDIKKILTVEYTLSYLYSDIGKFPGGAAVEWYHWIKGFRSNGIQIGVMTFRGQRDFISKSLDFEIIETWSESQGIPKLRIIYPIIPSFIKAIKRFKPDILVMETARRETFFLSIFAKIFKKKYIYRVASDHEVDNRIVNYVTKFNKQLFYLSLNLSDVIFCQNNYQLNQLKKKFPNKNIYLLNTPFSLNTEKNLIAKNERNYVAWIGTFRSVKNIPVLLSIIKKLPQIKFKIAGGKIIKGFTDDLTEHAVKELELLENVEFMPYMEYEDIPKFLGHSIMLINTSKSEGFSNTFLEAWAAGTPIVSTKNVNPNNIISDYNLGTIAENYDALPEAIQKILDMSDSEYEEISNRCVKYLKENHDAKLLASKFLEYVEKL